MSDVKHTRGPWVIEDPLGPDLSIVEVGKQTYEWAGRFIAHIPHYERGEWEQGHLSSAEIHANARLIAAAPDLLEALKELLSGHDSLYLAHFGPLADPRNDIAAKVARAAIARAEGREQVKP
jgi:hypothetical protein